LYKYIYRLVILNKIKRFNSVHLYNFGAHKKGMQKISLAIHGGAGTILPADMTPQLEEAYLTALQQALDAGYTLLQNGGTAVDAVQAATVCLEDNILFNAGRGSVFTKRGQHEMDAAIMDGSNLAAGAVAGVRNVCNPVKLAATIMQHSNHVFLSGDGAAEFALTQGLAIAPDDYFFSQFRYDQWKLARDSNEYLLDHNQQQLEQLMKDKKFGTVGAVACDARGNIAAATSTGGMTNKKYGRIGDSPVIGAGTYANNNTCAISCTGHGEPFIRAVTAYDVSCLIEYKNLNLQQAMHLVVHTKLPAIDGEGGMIGVDAKGNTALLFNSAGMYRAVKNSDGLHEVAIYGNQ
jgi:L-asparaginase / beta-aspartyl-peptidase